MTFRVLPTTKTRKGKLYDGRTHEAIAAGARKVWTGLKILGKKIKGGK